MTSNKVTRRMFLVACATGAASLALPSFARADDAAAMRRKCRAFHELLRGHREASQLAEREFSSLARGINAQGGDSVKLRETVAALEANLRESRELLGRVLRGERVPPPKRPEYGSAWNPNAGSPRYGMGQLGGYQGCPSLLERVVSERGADSVKELRLVRDGSGMVRLESGVFILSEPEGKVKFVMLLTQTGYTIYRISRPLNNAWERVEMISDAYADGVRLSASGASDVYRKEFQDCRRFGSVRMRERDFRESGPGAAPYGMGALGIHPAVERLEATPEQANEVLSSMIGEAGPLVRRNLAELRVFRRQLMALAAGAGSEAKSLARRAQSLETEIDQIGKGLVENGYPNALCRLQNVRRTQYSVQRAEADSYRGSLSVYYDTAKAAMSADDMKRIRGYLNSLRPGEPVIVEGHCDERGSDEYNMRLGFRRAQAVIDAIGKMGYGQRTFIRASYGKRRPVAKGHNEKAWRQNRRAVIVPNARHYVSRGLTLLAADYYLLDLSGSMTERLYGWSTKWDEVLSHAFPMEAGIFGLTATQPEFGDMDIARVRPAGMTPLYSALVQLMAKAPRDKEVCVLTDGEDNLSEYHGVDDVVKMAKKRGMRISVVGIGLRGQYLDDMFSLAKGTGGGFYFISGRE